VEVIMGKAATRVGLKEELAKYARKLRQELDSKKPRVYASLVWAYQDSRVQDAIRKRLEAGEILTSSSQIVPDRALRRERVYFDFSPTGRLDAKHPGILVQINDDNSVAEIVDPFDLYIGPDVAAASAADTLPLSAARSSLMGQSTADVEAARQIGVRWTRFVEQPELARTFGGFGGFGGLGGAFESTDTLSGGTPTLSSVMSSRGSKEDPDQDTQGARFDDSAA